MRPSIVGITWLSLLTLSTAGRAQPSPEEATRASLIVQSERARDAGDHARALDLATLASRIRPTPSLLLLLAQEHAALGHLVVAYEEAQHCLRDLATDASAHNRERIQATCSALVEGLGRQVGRIVVRVPSMATNGLDVRIDGRVVAPDLYGQEIPVLPGPLQIEATTTNEPAQRWRVQVQAGATSTVSIPPQRAHVADASPSHVETTDRPPPAIPEVALADVHSQVEGRGPGIGPWILGGIGLLGLGLAGTFWVLHGSAVSDRDRSCDASGCAPEAVTFNDRAREYTTLTNVALSVGTLGVAAGVLWLIIDRPPRRATQGSAWNLEVSHEHSGTALTVRGRF